MKRISPCTAHWAAAAAALWLCACASPPKETLQNVSYPDGLSQVVTPPDLQIKDRQAVSFAFKPGESLEHWTEIAGRAMLPAEASMDAKMAWAPMTSAFKSCPSQAKSMRVVPVSPQRANYEMQLKDCPGQPDYIQVGTIIEDGTHAWHVFYGTKARELSAARRTDVQSRLDAIRAAPQ